LWTLWKSTTVEGKVDDAPFIGTQLSYLTPLSQIEALVVIYDRNMLYRLLAVNSSQSHKLGEGRNLSFDWGMVQQGIINKILAGKSQVTMIHHYFQYRGERVELCERCKSCRHRYRKWIY
jgi:hypothetical protein